MRLLKNRFLTYLFLLCTALSSFKSIKAIGGNDSDSQKFSNKIIIDNNLEDQVNSIENMAVDVGSSFLQIALMKMNLI